MGEYKNGQFPKYALARLSQIGYKKCSKLCPEAVSDK
jgi:hypothetical protein